MQQQSVRLFTRSFVGALALTVLMQGCTCSRQAPKQDSAEKEEAPASKTPDYSGITVNKVIVYDKDKDKSKVKGEEAKEGSSVTCNYGMWVYDPRALGNRGAEIASGKDFTFTIGKNEVIKGFEQGVLGMKPGSQRTILVPAELAYGVEGNDRVPPKAIVQVEVQLKKISR